MLVNINIKSDGDQPDAAQAKLHAAHSPVSDVASLSMSSTYGPSTSTIQQQQNTKTTRFQCWVRKRMVR